MVWYNFGSHWDAKSRKVIRPARAWRVLYPLQTSHKGQFSRFWNQLRKSSWIYAFKWPQKNNLPPHIDTTSDFSEVTSPVTFSTVSATQSLPILISVSMSELMPDWKYFTGYLTLTSDLKDEAIPSSGWSRWELQPSEKSQESPAARQRLSIATSLTWSSPESVLAPCQLGISGEFLGFSSVNFQKWLSFLQRKASLLWSQVL